MGCYGSLKRFKDKHSSKRRWEGPPEVILGDMGFCFKRMLKMPISLIDKNIY